MNDNLRAGVARTILLIAHESFYIFGILTNIR